MPFSFAVILNPKLKIENSININAPKNVVWAVTEDIEGWPEWTPTVTKTRLLGNDSFGLGSKVNIKQPGQPESEWMVTEYVQGESFTWKTSRTGMQMAATHLLKENGADTLNILRIEVSGILAVLLWPVLRLAIRHALLQENQGLKTRCEETLISTDSSFTGVKK